LDGIDLSSWTVAFCGAEPVRRHTMDQFAARFGAYGFRKEALYSCYGLAEATLIVTGSAHLAGVVSRDVSRQGLALGRTEPPISDKDAYPVVSSGAVVDGTGIVIVDSQSTVAAAPGQVGEVWVTGPGVAQGYWNRVDDTLATFHASIPSEPTCRYMRTGDLGFVDDGMLYLTGRCKDVLIVGGRNYYPHDIEAASESAHPALNRNASAAFNTGGRVSDEIVLVQELVRSHRSYDLGDVVQAVRESVFQACDAPLAAIHLVRLGQTPKTSSGKIRRSACRDALAEGSLDVIYSWSAAGDTQTNESEPQAVSSDSIADRVTALVSRVMRIPRPVVVRAFSDGPITLDSPAAADLLYAIEAEFGALLNLSDLLRGISLDQLIADVSIGGVKVVASEANKSDSGGFPLSSGQQAIWMLQQLSPKSHHYNISGCARILQSGSTFTTPD
jgi:hypothetical protein